MARPKRVIVVAEADDAARDVRRFVLETRGYRALGAQSPELLDRVLRETEVDLVVASAPAFTRTAKRLRRHVPVIEIGGGIGCVANRVMVGRPTPVELLECVRVVVARKRGPKKQAMGDREQAAAKAVVA